MERTQNASAASVSPANLAISATIAHSALAELLLEETGSPQHLAFAAVRGPPLAPALSSTVALRRGRRRERRDRKSDESDRSNSEDVSAHDLLPSCTHQAGKTCSGVNGSRFRSARLEPGGAPGMSPRPAPASPEPHVDNGYGERQRQSEYCAAQEAAAEFVHDRLQMFSCKRP